MSNSNFFLNFMASRVAALSIFIPVKRRRSYWWEVSSFEVEWSRCKFISKQFRAILETSSAWIQAILRKGCFPNSENFLCCLHSLRISQCSPLHITRILKWQPIDCGQEEPKSWTTDYKFLSFQICSDSQAQKAVDWRRTFDCCLLSLRSLLCYSLVWSHCMTFIGVIGLIRKLFFQG